MVGIRLAKSFGELVGPKFGGLNATSPQSIVVFIRALVAACCSVSLPRLRGRRRVAGSHSVPEQAQRLERLFHGLSGLSLRLSVDPVRSLADAPLRLHERRPGI